MNTKIVLVVAYDENRVIGSNNTLPWDIPEDRKHFKNITNKGIVLMGRKTYESILEILGKPLPNRQTIVLTRDKDYNPGHDSVKVIDKPETVYAQYPDQTIYVVGGGEIYRLFLDRASEIYATEIAGHHDGDTFFPKLEPSEWTEKTLEEFPKFKFVHYLKK